MRRRRERSRLGRKGGACFEEVADFVAAGEEVVVTYVRRCGASFPFSLLFLRPCGEARERVRGCGEFREEVLGFGYEDGDRAGWEVVGDYQVAVFVVGGYLRGG